MSAGGGTAEKFPVTIAGGDHLYPYRTQKLSLQTLMVLSWERLGRVGSCRDPSKGAGGTEVFPAPNNANGAQDSSKPGGIMGKGGGKGAGRAGMAAAAGSRRAGRRAGSARPGAGLLHRICVG